MNRGRYYALVVLAWLAAKGRVRLVGRSFKTVRGIIAFIVGFGMFAMWLSSSFLGMLLRRRTSDVTANPAELVGLENLRLYFALTLLGYALVTFLFRHRGIGVHFKPAEIDFLFPAPYHRRELLVYKLAISLAGVVLTAAIFSLFFGWAPVPWPILFFGLFLAISFALLLNMLASTLALALSARLYTRVRQVVVLALSAFIVVAALWLRKIYWEEDPQWNIEMARRPVAQILLAPFLVFARAATAPDVRTFLPHALLAAAINAGMILFIVLLDADYYESSITATRRTYERLRRIRRGDLFAYNLKGARARSLPELPRLAGVGPIAWRQATAAIRTLPRFLLLLLLVALPLTVAGLGIGIKEAGESGGFLTTLAVMVFVFMPSAFRFDFRGDVDKMSWLKSLPLAPWAIVVGELLPATVLLVLIQLILLAAIVGSLQFWQGLAALPILPAAAFIAFAVDNFLFLLFPTRRTVMYPGDFQSLGYVYLVGVTKVITFMLIFGFAAAVGAAAYYLSGHSIAVTSATVTVLLTIVAGAWVPLLVWAYNRFDPSLDVPVD